jgi:hypothetical protein
VKIGVYDFYYPPKEEAVFLALLRSTGLSSLVGMERKGVSGPSSDRVMRLTGHLQGLPDAFAYMETLVRHHGYRAEKTN